jgi:hypothetical protein
VYILDTNGNQIDRITDVIAWWTQEQAYYTRRFVSGRLIESDVTFNKNDRRMLL